MPIVIALIGRPNVGKSTLFNRMVRGRAARESTAITEETPGVTRDRNYRTVRWNDREFVLVDTGGIVSSGSAPGGEDVMSGLIREQAMKAVEEADLIVHLCDANEGTTPEDRDLSALLRKSRKKVLVVVNKIDSVQKIDRIYEFYSLGFDKVIPVSGLSGYGFNLFMETLAAEIPGRGPESGPPEEPEMPRIAVVGRPNVGKSTLINTLLNSERLIVTPIPGTTRDSIDSVCRYYGKEYLFIDTAGIRRKVPRFSIEEFSVMRSLKSIERADVVLLVLDASQGVVDQDQKIAGMAAESGKGLLLILNKWDLVSDPEKTFVSLSREIRRKTWEISYAPLLTISGMQKKRVTRIFPMIDEVIRERKKRVSTADLNRSLSEITESSLFPASKGKEVKAYYMTQTGIEPPSFVVFVNLPSAFSPAVRKGFEKALRERHGFTGTPLRITFKSR